MLAGLFPDALESPPMKGFDIQQGSTGKRPERDVGDAPSLGHVERVQGSRHLKPPKRGKRDHQARKRRHLDRKRRRLVILTWSIVFALVALVIVGGSVALWLRRDDMKNLVIGKETNITPVDDKRVPSRFPSPSREVAVDFVTRAMRVRDPARVPEFFRLGSTTAAAVATYLENMEGNDGPITKYQWLSSMDPNNMLVDGVSVHTKQGDKTRTRLALLTPDEKGKWKIDFEAFARIVKPTWPEVLNSSPEHDNIVRVQFTADNYYNGPFKDESQWICYRLGSPDLTDDILGYCRRKSPQATAMKLIVAAGNKPSNPKGLRRATLEIRRIKDGEARQFEITRVLAEDWVLNATPFDAPF